MISVCCGSICCLDFPPKLKSPTNSKYFFKNFLFFLRLPPMQKSDLVEILGVLTKEEQKSLTLFLDHTTNLRTECVRLVRYLLDCLNQNDLEKIQRNTVYEKIFPGKEWVENKLPKLMAETLAIVRKFVANTAADRQMTDLQQLFYLQTFYQERNLEDKFWATHRQIIDSKKKIQWQTEQDYYTRFLSENQTYRLQSTRNNRKDDLNLICTIKTFDEYYLIERQTLVCQLLNQSLVAPLDFSSLSNTFLRDLNKPEWIWFFEKPLGMLFATAIGLLLNENEENSQEQLRNFVELIWKQESEISGYYITLFENSACNYCTRRINKGENQYLEILFEIHKHRVSSGRIYVENGMISPSEIFNTVLIALRLKEFDWVKDFIESHKKKVLGVMPSEQYYEFALANYLFHLKDYQETCRILMTTDYEDIHCKYFSRILEIKALAEQFFREKADHRIGEYLEDRVEAAILFFFRLKDVEASKKKMGKRFADTMKRIIHAEGKRDVERLEIILQDITKAEYIAERQWLTKLVEDLIARYKKG